MSSRPSLRELFVAELKVRLDLLNALRENNDVVVPAPPAPTLPVYAPGDPPLYGVCDLCLRKRDGVLVYAFFMCPAHSDVSRCCGECFEKVPPAQRRETYCAWCKGLNLPSPSPVSVETPSVPQPPVVVSQVPLKSSWWFW